MNLPKTSSAVFAAGLQDRSTSAALLFFASVIGINYVNHMFDGLISCIEIYRCPVFVTHFL